MFNGFPSRGLRLIAVLSVLVCVAAVARAQTAVPVGAGSYASSLPPAVQWQGGFYSMAAQQVVTQYANLHLESSLTNRPLPSNQWWTDLLVGDRSYQPAANVPRTIVQDAYGGQLWAYPGMVDPEPFGFNLYFPNAWTPTGANAWVPQGSFMTGPALRISGGVPLAVGASDILIADFEGATYPAGWTSTGTAFGAGPIAGGGWPGQSPAVQGFLGAACVNTYRGSDSPTGTLTSATFTLTKNFIHLLAGGGNNTALTAVRLVVSNNIVRTAIGQQDGTLRWNTWDVSGYVGQSAQIQIADLSSGSWGFIMCDFIVASDDGSNPAVRYTDTFTPPNSVVTDWSDWGVQFGMPDALGRRMDVTLARGVPFVWTRCTGLNPRINLGASATLYDTNGAAILRTNNTTFIGSAFAFDYQGRTFGVFAPDNTAFLTTGDNLEAQLSGTNNYLVYAFLPARTNLAEFAQYAYARVTNTTYAWDYDVPNGRVITTWNLATAPLQGRQTNTLQGWLPHHYRTTANVFAFKPYNYLTPRGVMKVAVGNTFQFSYNFRGIAPVLPAPQTNNLPNDFVGSRMTNYVQNFAANNPYYVGDTYGQGKETALAAQYMTFARQMGLTNQAAQLAAGLRNILANWFTYTPGETSYFFARYANWRALIGFPPGYGSEAFNDNHFHYGYFLHAAALLGMEDPNFLAQYGPMARLVAKEYANWDRSETNFPFLRTFDIWEGHSHAGGFSGGGGNNQESSSEAMNSWVGLFLLGNQLGDSAMTAAGAMGYAVESTAVNEYWQDLYRTNLPASYGKGIVGIVWTGGLSYGTYFSGDPAWIYGIQWVPANHWNNYLTRDKSFARWQLTNMWNERVVASQNNLNGFTLADANNAVAQGAYLGNYILGYQTLFDSDGVAAIMQAAYATNAAIATDATYSGVNYYLTHALRRLGDQDADYYTSAPTSQVYYNATTGKRSYVIYNPAPTNQTVTVYHFGVPVDTVSVPPGKLTVTVAGQTNIPSQIALTIQLGAQISWPTTLNTTWTLQSTDVAGINGPWTTLLGPTAGTGSTNTWFDLAWQAPHRQYRVLEITSGSTNVLVNPSFENGSGVVISNWSAVGSQPPARVSTAAQSGTYSMQLFVTNVASTPNTSEINQNLTSAGGAPIVPGRTYNFSFWARQLSSGVSYVQNYRLGWLNSSGGTVGSVGFTGFSASSSAWTQITVNNLVAPANAVNAYLQIYGATGAVLNGSGGVLIDDVALATSSVSQTNVVTALVQSGVQIRWPSLSGKNYDVQSLGDLGNGNWSNLASALPGTGSTNVVTDIFASNAVRFYRVIELN